MAGARLTPVPFPCAARKDLGVFKEWMALDFYVAPGKVRNTRGIRFCVAHGASLTARGLVQRKKYKFATHKPSRELCLHILPAHFMWPRPGLSPRSSPLSSMRRRMDMLRGVHALVPYMKRQRWNLADIKSVTIAGSPTPAFDRTQDTPWSRLTLSQGCADSLLLGVEIEGIMSHLTAPARLLVAAEG
jgi:hypothetical protein